MMASSSRSVIIVENKYQEGPSSSSDVSMTSGYILQIPAALIWSWKDAKPNKLVTLVNNNLGHGLKLNNLKESLKERLRKKVMGHANKVRKLACRPRTAYLRHNHVLFDACKNEVIDVCDLRKQVTSLEENLQLVNEECRRKEATVKKLKADNKKLQDSLSATSGAVNLLGKTYDEVAERQKKRKVSRIKAATEKTLGPVYESHGLSLCKVVMISQNDEEVTLDYGCSSSDSTEIGSSGNKKGDQTLIDHTLFGREVYSISDTMLP